jgi:hypothetical protein
MVTFGSVTNQSLRPIVSSHRPWGPRSVPGGWGVPWSSRAVPPPKTSRPALPP